MDSASRTKLVDQYVEEYRDEICKLASELIKIPSENIAPHGYEKECQDYLLGYLKTIKGIETDYFTPCDVAGLEDHPAYRAGRDYSNRPNVVATKVGTGNGKSVLLSSHVDTVSKKPLPWPSGDPFSGKIEDGKLYGRGSFDMKGGLASTVMCLKIMAEKGLSVKGNVIVESVVDEENAGSIGTLAARLRGHNADVAILPEPTLLDICPASKGGKIFRIDLDGRAGTGYGGEATVNPIHGIGLLAYKIAEYYKQINAEAGQGGPYYENEQSARTIIMDKIQAGDLDPGGNLGVPDNAWFSLFINTLPGYTEDMLDDEFRSFIEKVVAEHREVFPTDPHLQHMSRYLWPYEVDAKDPSIAGLVRASEECGIEAPVVTGAKFACDGFIFHKYFNTPTITFGPRGENAHAQDEYVLVEDLILLTKIYLNFILEWCNETPEN